MKSIDRRAFLKKSSIAGAALGTAGLFPEFVYGQAERPAKAQYMGGFAAPKLDTVRAAFIGVGARGGYHLKFLAALPGTEVVAICDVYEDLVKEKEGWVREVSGSDRHTDIKLYSGDENQWRTMLKEVRPDVVFIATNWTNHAPMAIASMEAGAHACGEVPMAVTLSELWDIVDASERTQRHCMMLENVNYSRDELLFLNLCRKGLIGELLHGEAAYIHELRWQMEEQHRGTGSWRTHHYAKRNGNLYPTHGLGPVAQYMNLGRGEDTFGSLVSFSTPAVGRQAYARKNYPENHQWNAL